MGAGRQARTSRGKTSQAITTSQLKELKEVGTDNTLHLPNSKTGTASSQR